MTMSMKRETDDKGLTHKHGTPYALHGRSFIVTTFTWKQTLVQNKYCMPHVIILCLNIIIILLMLTFPKIIDYT